MLLPHKSRSKADDISGKPDDTRAAEFDRPLGSASRPAELNVSVERARAATRT